MGKPLTASQIEKVTTPGLYRAGPGLYVQVRASGAKHWALRYQLNGRARMMGLGSTRLFSLTDATKRARIAQVMLADKIDPIDARRGSQPVVPRPVSTAPTFEKFAGTYIETHRAGWRNPKHAQQWENTLATYVFPHLGKLPVSDITVEDVLKVLKTIWTTKPETASRLRGRIEQILGAAEASKHRAGANPASWKGALRHLLPALNKVQKVEHHAALPYKELPALMARVRSRDGCAARAIEFVGLTAARSGEVRGAKWSEIDLTAKTWTVPAERMKAGREHRVPLSDEALALLPSKAGAPSALLFPGARRGAPLSDMSLLAVLRRLKVATTVHGFRSSFRDWAAETGATREVAEACLAHAVGNAVEQAYRRTDFLEQRRALMDAWGKFVVGSADGK